MSEPSGGRREVGNGGRREVGGGGRREVGSGGAYEERVGYCRAVRSGPLVSVSGTAAVEPDGGVTPGGAGAQAERIFQIIEQALRELDASMEQVVRTRIYVVNVEDWPAVAAVFRGRFGESRPTATLVEVSGLIERSMLVEIEVDAWSPELT